MMVGKNTHVFKILHLIPENTVGAEIGVWKSNTSDLFLSRKPKHLYLVDPWSVEPYKGDGWERYVQKYQKVTGGFTEIAVSRFYDSLYKTIQEKFSKRTDVSVHRSYSTEWFNSMEDNSLDWIYVDGDHSYDGVTSDLHNCLRVVKTGNYIYGDDYSDQKKEVKDAVDDFVKEHNLKFELIYENQWRILNSADV